MSSEIIKISISEFRRLGFLQELNRQFLHPLGMALEVTIKEDGSEILSGVWDYRNDPEGILFKEGVAEKVKADFVAEFAKKKHEQRKKLLGFVVQPIYSPE